MLTQIDLPALRAAIPELAAAYRTAEPFPHVVSDLLIRSDRLEAVLASFPDACWEGWANADHPLQATKRECQDIERMPPTLRAILHELHSGPFIRMVEEITGERGLVADPHLHGAGLHLSLPGGDLIPHSDFVHGIVPGLERRVTLILYVSSGWEPADQGQLDLWKGARIVAQVAPCPGRFVLMKNGADTVHGISAPVARRERRSIAVFYYAASGRGIGAPISDASFWRLLLRRSAGRALLRNVGASLLLHIAFLFFRWHRQLYERAERLAKASQSGAGHAC